MKLLKSIFLLIAAAAVLVFTRQMLLPLLNNNSLLQIETPGVTARVYLNDKKIGETPFLDAKLVDGDYLLRIEADLDSPFSKSVEFSKEIPLSTGHLTAVNWEFGPDESFSSGDIRIKQTGEGLSITTTPADSRVFLNGNEVGSGPINVSPNTGIHMIRISKNGYYSRELEVNIESGKRLNLKVFLAVNPFDTTKKLWEGKLTLYDLSTDRRDLLSETQNWANGVFFFEKTKNLSFDALIDRAGNRYFKDKSAWDKKIEENKKIIVGYLGNKNENGLTDQAENIISIYKQKPKPEPVGINMVQITSIPTGFLNVRRGPGTSFSIVAKVNPGEKYELLEEKSGWYKIKISGSTGWVSTQYSKKV